MWPDVFIFLVFITTQRELLFVSKVLINAITHYVLCCVLKNDLENVRKIQINFIASHTNLKIQRGYYIPSATPGFKEGLGGGGGGGAS